MHAYNFIVASIIISYFHIFANDEYWEIVFEGVKVK